MKIKAVSDNTMNRVRQKIKAWKQNSEIRQVPYWRTEWMGKNPSAHYFYTKERDSYVEEMADWNMRINQRDRGHYCY